MGASSKIRDSIRALDVKATPEEVVRQKLLLRLQNLGYPRYLLSVEKSLRELVQHSWVGCPIPRRRVDIVCFTKQKAAPLLIIECKASVLDEKAKQQIIGYNHFIQAPFIALANHQQVITGWYNTQEERYTFIDVLPTYEALLNAVCH